MNAPDPRFTTGFAAKEIEHQFSVLDDSWQSNVSSSHHLTNYYFPKGAACGVTFALSQDGGHFEIRSRDDRTCLYAIDMDTDIKQAMNGEIGEHLFPIMAEDSPGNGTSPERFGNTTDSGHARVRFWQDEDGTEQAFLTLKTRSDIPHMRYEFELPIPLQVAASLLPYTPHHISKTRSIVMHEGQKWEIDQFGAPYQGLTIAEIELPTTGCEFVQPAWLGDEVNISNSAMARNARLVQRGLGEPPCAKGFVNLAKKKGGEAPFTEPSR